jgi:hypothetical protein
MFVNFYNNFLLSLVGPKNSKDIWAYDLKKNVWKILSFNKKAISLKERDSHSMVYHHGNIYIIGGKDESYSTMENCYVIHTYEKGGWSKENHLCYPLHFKKQIYVLVCIHKLYKEKIPCPKVILHLIFRFMSSNL